MKKKLFSKKEMTYHLMLLPGMLFLIVFSYIPMVGILMAFEDYVPAKEYLVLDLLGLSILSICFSYQIL